MIMLMVFQPDNLIVVEGVAACETPEVPTNNADPVASAAHTWNQLPFFCMTFLLL